MRGTNMTKSNSVPFQEHVRDIYRDGVETMYVNGTKKFTTRERTMLLSKKKQGRSNGKISIRREKSERT
jgi:hypothetical protein